MKLNQNQADALRWLADGKKVEAVGRLTGTVRPATAKNISEFIKGHYGFRLAPETIAPTMPKPHSADISLSSCAVVLYFETKADRDAALAAIRKEMK